MGPLHSDDPVSLFAGIISALVGLLIAVPIIMLLIKERRIARARDAQWEEATQRQRDQLNDIYDRRVELRDRLSELEPGDFKREMAVAAAYDRFIDACWAARQQGGLGDGNVLAEQYIERLNDLSGHELHILEELQVSIDEASDRLLARRRAAEEPRPEVERTEVERTEVERKDPDQ